MSTEQTTTSRSAYWQQHINAWQFQGGSKAQYCRDNALSYQVFNYWHSKLNPAKKPSTNLVPVAINSPTETAPSNTLQLELPNGMQITGIRAESMSLVSQLIAQL